MVTWIFRIFTADDLHWNCFFSAVTVAWCGRPPRMPRTVTSRKIYMRLKALAYAE